MRCKHDRGGGGYHLRTALRTDQSNRACGIRVLEAAQAYPFVEILHLRDTFRQPVDVESCVSARSSRDRRTTAGQVQCNNSVCVHLHMQVM
jgi:hypothetical protein